jgi:peptidoglycan hydrolase-like protein with peptidoglycan-binding domain
MNSFEFELMPFGSHGSYEAEAEAWALERRRGRVASRARSKPPRSPSSRSGAKSGSRSASRPKSRPPGRYMQRRRLRRVLPAAPCVCPVHGTEYVRWVQSALNQVESANLPVNGVMSAATRSALRKFQSSKGLPVDGIAGPEVEQALRDARQPAQGQGEVFEFETTGLEAATRKPTLHRTDFPGQGHNALDGEVGFDSPTRTPRKVRTHFVSCRKPSAAIAAITGPDPVGTIRRANTRAIALLDRSIKALQTSRDGIRKGAAVGPPTVSARVVSALRGRFRLDPGTRSNWTGSGARSVLVLIRRLRGARRILADGWMKYTCLGADSVKLGKCARTAGNGCPPSRPDRRAVSCPGRSRIVLCRAWWSDGVADQASTLLHECFHIYFGFIGDSGNFGNAHCYEQFVLDVNGLLPQAGFAGSCP